MPSQSNKELLIALGKHVRSIRQKRGLTQLDLAVRVNKDYQSIQRLERGSINPSFVYLYEIFSGLDINLEEIIEQIES
ncbi:MAG: helix-turn-helix transcriptional regulator [Flavobacteriales bacterium]